MNSQITEQLRRTHLLILPWLLGGLVSACASRISPQIFPRPTPVSDSLRNQLDAPLDCSEYESAWTGSTVRRRFDTQHKLCLVRARADLLRQDYVAAVVNDSTENAVLSSLLVAIAGAAGYQLLRNGLTSAPTQPLTSLAAAGATIYGYSSLTHSPARQLVRLAGAEALTCIYQASGELQIPAADLREIVDHSRHLRKTVDDLRSTLGQLSAADLRRSDRCITRPAKTRDCKSGTTGSGQQLFDSAPPKGCADGPAVKSCDLSLARAIKDLEPEIADADAMHARVETSLNEIDRLVGRVRGATDELSYSIGREVLKTEASPAAALTAIQSMRGVLAQLSGTAQKGPKVSAVERSRHADLEAEFYELRNAKARVREDERDLSARLTVFTEKMRACQSYESASRISLSPLLEHLDLIPNQPFAFSATGNSGTPAVNLLNDTAKAIDLQIAANANVLNATVKLTKADKAVNATLQFNLPGATSIEVPLVYFPPRPAAK